MAISNITSMPAGIGNLPQIAFNSGVLRQLSQDMTDFQMVQVKNVKTPAGREFRFMLHTAGGPAAIQSSAISSARGAFPRAQRSKVEEKTAIYKEYNATVEISEALAARLAMAGGLKYADQLAIELEDKKNYAARRLGADFHLDGTGVMGTVGSIVDTTGADGSVLVSLSVLVSARGHVNVFEFGDLLLAKQAAGAARSPTVVGTFYGYEVIDVIRESDQVRLAPIDVDGARLSLTASNLVAGDVFYRIGQVTIPDLTAALGDLASVTESLVGLESLVSADGRLVNGTTMSGVTRSIVLDKSGETADVRHLMTLIDALENRNGRSSGYRWNKVLCANEYVSTQADTWRQDRRFQSSSDRTLGGASLKFEHGKYSMDFYTSEFARKDRQWVIPEGGPAGKSPVAVHFSPFKASKDPNGGSQWTRAFDADGSPLKAWQQFMLAFIGAYNGAPSACGVIKGATIGV